MLFSLSGLVLEGAGIDWSAIYMRDVFDTAPFIGGLAVATGAFAQGAARYVADRFVERHSPLAIARTLLGVLGLGTLMVTFAPASPVALLGFALMGVGTSVMFPLAMSAAAQRTDRPAATNVAALAQISFVSFLLGPPLLGLRRRTPRHPLDLRPGIAAGGAERGGVVDPARAGQAAPDSAPTPTAGAKREPP